MSSDAATVISATPSSISETKPQQQQQQQNQNQNQNQPAVDNSAALKEKFRSYYERIFPAEKLVQWLQYGNETGTYLLHREFCFTLPGDVFWRYKSFSSDKKLREALVRDCPEKIDAGAVYQVPPDKRHQTPLVSQERELVFDIDMSDYDSIRSCCKGKQICRHCWAWMSTAAHIIKHFVTTCFGYKILLPVFSGRRGIHVWVCDAAARKLSDEDRNAIVSFMTVMIGEWKLNCAFELKTNRPHPTLDQIQTKFLDPAFDKIFLNPNNTNCIYNNKDSANVFRKALLAVHSQLTGAMTPQVLAKLYGKDNEVISEQELKSGIQMLKEKSGNAGLGVVRALQLALLYPRLDEHVSTRKDHLLKLPLCVHPGTGRLCCPLEFGDSMQEFDPVADPPTLDTMLDELGCVPSKWMKPLLDVIEQSKEEMKMMKK